MASRILFRRRSVDIADEGLIVVLVIVDVVGVFIVVVVLVVVVVVAVVPLSAVCVNL